MSTSRRGFFAAISSTVQGSAADMGDQQHAHEHQVVPSDLTLRVKALESLLVEKGLVDPAALEKLLAEPGVVGRTG